MKYKNYPTQIWDRIRQALVEEKKQHSSPVAAFDADGTLWDTDLGENFFKYQIEQKLLSELPQDPWGHYRQWKASGDPRPAYLWLAQINQGHALSEVRAWADAALRRLDPLPIFDEQKKLIEFLMNEGVQVYLVTASVRWAVEPGAKRLGISEENVIGVETKSESGILTDVQSGFMTYREGKVQGLLARTGGLSPFLSVGNTTGDLQLLRAATHVSLAVGAALPEDELFETEEKLRQNALQNHWLIHRFT